MNLTTLTMADAAAAMARGELSPVELTEAHLAQIERLEPEVNAFITVTAAEARAGARAAAAEMRRGMYRGPLHGVPVALKDLFETAGVRTTAGSRHLAGYVPVRDSAVVARLRASGAVLLGKLNLHEWAMSVTNQNPFYGDCRNPWDPDRIPGGSSGGSGAALAAEMCLGALGSDTGGSIRVPAALCGVVGLKPTFGRVPTRGMLPLSRNLDHAGPMARRVRDVTLLLQALAGHDLADPYSARVPVPDFTSELEAGVQGWRVAAAWEGFLPPGKHIHPDVLAAFEEAIRVFAALGAKVEAVSLPGIAEGWPTYSRMLMSDALAVHRERLEQAPEDFSAETLGNLRHAQSYSARDYAEARHDQTLLRHRFEQLWERYDLLLTPTTGVPARRRDEPESARATHPSLVSFTAPFNVVGLPALSLPNGLTTEGLPIGLQLVAPAWAEAALLRAAYAFEQATPWHMLHPPLVESGL